MTTPDNELLENYRTTGHEALFTELVKRHLGLVHSAALRITRQPALAQDISQTVFTKLARLRKPLPGDLLLVTWLHRTTRSASIDLVRAESRRREREETAASITMKEPSLPWEAISPVLDEVIDRLSPDDRQLVLCRYFNGESHVELARSLGLSEDAVRMRLNRALEKVRSLLQKRGITTTASALAISLPAYAISPIPAGLVSSVVSTAILPAILPTTLITLGFITMTKQTATIAAAVLLLAAAGTALYVTSGKSPAAAVKTSAASPSSASAGDPSDTTTHDSPDSKSRSRDRTASQSEEDAKLISKYGESRVKLAKRITESLSGILGESGLIGLGAEMDGEDESEMINDFQKEISLSDAQKAKVGELFHDAWQKRHDNLKDAADYVKSKPKLVAESFLAGDAFKRNQISEEEYKAIASRLDPQKSDLVGTFGQIFTDNNRNTALAQEEFVGKLKPLLETSQIKKLDDYIAANHPPDNNNKVKNEMWGENFPVSFREPDSLESLDKQISDDAVMIGSLIRIKIPSGEQQTK